MLSSDHNLFKLWSGVNTEAGILRTYLSQLGQQLEEYEPYGPALKKQIDELITYAKTEGDRFR